MDTNFPAIMQSNIWWDEIQAVNARDLWSFLAVWDKFTDWIKPKIQEFAEGIDYITFSGIPEKGRPSTEYVISLDTAKNISMMQKNEKWKEVRKYFIECERIVKKPRTYEVIMHEALQLADTRVRELEDKILIDAPKVAFASAIEWSTASAPIWNWIKAISNEWKLKMWRNKAFDWMRSNGFLMKDNNPYQRYVDQWLFEVKEWLIVTTKWQISTFTTLLTWKWQIFFLEKLS